MILCEKRTVKKVFLGTVEIAGYYYNLALGLTECGVNCNQVVLTPHKFEYAECSDLPFFVRWIRYMALLRQRMLGRHGFNKLLRLSLAVGEMLLRIFLVLPWAVINFDVFIFGFNSNIVGSRLGYWDVRLLRWLGKRIIYVYHGSDSRPEYLNGAIIQELNFTGNSSSLKKLYNLTRKKKKLLQTIEKYANVILSNPVHAHFHERPFVNIMNIGLPYKPEKAQVSLTINKSKNHRDCIRILHAPSHRSAKGSDVIKACIDDLIKKDYPIKYIEIHSLPHSEVIMEIQDCDFIIDQIYSDAPMAGFATEAASYGKPAIVCGYLEDRTWIDQIPTYYCHPDELKLAIERFINEETFRKEIGCEAKLFVEEQWSVASVAKRFLKVIEDDIPEAWWFNPKDVLHTHGWGVSEANLKQSLGFYLDEYGSSALLLDDKPKLRDKLTNLARDNS